MYSTNHPFFIFCPRLQSFSFPHVSPPNHLFHSVHISIVSHFLTSILSHSVLVFSVSHPQFFPANHLSNTVIISRVSHFLTLLHQKLVHLPQKVLLSRRPNTSSSHLTPTQQNIASIPHVLLFQYPFSFKRINTKTQKRPGSLSLSLFKRVYFSSTAILFISFYFCMEPQNKEIANQKTQIRV